MRIAFAVTGLGLLTACATLQAPLPGVRFQQPELVRITREGIDLGIKPIVAEDDYLRLFDDYLPRIGMVALWVEIGNERPTAIGLDPARCLLRLGDRDTRALGVAEVFKRYYGGHHVRMYSVAADTAAQRNMEMAVFKRGNILPAQKRTGFLFFCIEPGTAADWTRTARLIVCDISLDRRSKITVEIDLSHADP